MEQYEQLIRSTVSRYYKVTEDQEDAAQEVWYLVLKTRGKYDITPALLRTFAKNYCLNYIKKRKLDYMSYGTLYADWFTHHSCGNLSSFWSNKLDIENSIARLSKRQRRVMELIISGYSYHEVAEMLPTSYNAVKLVVRDARKRLKEFGILV